MLSVDTCLLLFFYGPTKPTMHPGGTRYFLCVLRAGVSAHPDAERSPPFSNEGCALAPQEKCAHSRGCGPIDGSVSLTAASAASAAALQNKKWPPRPATTQPAHRTERGAEPPPPGDPPSPAGLKEASENPPFSRQPSSGPSAGDMGSP